MLPYSATDVVNSMASSFGLTIDPTPAREPARPSRVARWLRALVHHA